MKCLYPVKKTRVSNGTRMWYTHPCGQCMSCRITRRQQWALRIMLESYLHENNCFLTLTYDEDTVPRVLDTDAASGLPTLSRPDLQNFLKRLRKNLDKKIRYFAVGEYGDRTSRPHYHLVIFGLSHTERNVIEKSWSLDGRLLGHFSVYELTKQRASYTARYTVKKMTSDDQFTDGRYPEFSMMSRGTKKNKLGGIGRGFTNNLIENFQKAGIEFVYDQTETIKRHLIPTAVRIDGSLLPLDSYMRQAIINDYTGGVIDEEHEKLMADIRDKLQCRLEDHETEKEQKKLTEKKCRSFQRTTTRSSV